MRKSSLLATIGLAVATPVTAQTVTAAAVSTTTAQDRISVEVQGAGPDVVLIPGLASSIDVWSDLAGSLRKDHRLHLVQLAGFGGAPAIADNNSAVAAPAAEAIARYIQDAGLQAPTIIGHSMGGEIGLMLAARHPDLVGRLMVVDALPFYSLLLDPSATANSMKPQAQAYREAMLSAPAAQADAMQAAALDRLIRSDAEKPALVAASLASDRATVAHATYELMTTDLRPELQQITVPVQVVYAYDPIYGVPASRIDTTFHRAYAATPDVSFARIDDSLHFIMLDQPEAFERIVLDFLD